MKISELIQELQKVQSEFGDLDCILYNPRDERYDTINESTTYVMEDYMAKFDESDFIEGQTYCIII